MQSSLVYLRNLHLRNLRLIRDLELSFVDDRGEPRMWTVLVGPNATGKTSILQAIALAAVGGLRANQLAGSTSVSMPDRRRRAALRIEAAFGWGSLADEQGQRRYPGSRSARPALIRSFLSMPAGSRDLVGRSRYEYGGLLDFVAEDGSITNPLQRVRSHETSHWFVGGYGASRVLTTHEYDRPGSKPSHDRLVSLFRPIPLIGLGFADLLEEQKARCLTRILHTLLTTTADLVPDIRNVEVQRRGELESTTDLYDRGRFEQVLPDGSAVELPATWLSHGYQASVAWLADLVGHYLLDLDADAPPELEPEHMEGLVLIDALDLHLHPTWQAGLIEALALTFPRLQFVATTHSPLLLSSLRPEDVVVLSLDEKGNVQARRDVHDPRLATGTELYSKFFGIDRLYPSDLGDALDRYSRLAVDPFRTQREQAELERLAEQLREEGIEITLEPVEREDTG